MNTTTPPTLDTLISEYQLLKARETELLHQIQIAQQMQRPHVPARRPVAS